MQTYKGWIARLASFVIASLVVGLLTPFFSPVYAATGDPADLMQQGKVRTCLKAAWNNESDQKGSKQLRAIHLTGRCEAPSGCDCLLNQMQNGAVAADRDGNLDSEFCEETAKLDSPEKVQQLAQVLGISSSLMAKWAPKKEMTQAEKDERNKKLRNRCQKAIREANDPVLAAVPVGVRKCNIVKNNIASRGSSNSNVLGLTADGKIPYGNVDIVIQEDTYKHAPISFTAVGSNDPVGSGGTGKTDVAKAGLHTTLKNALLGFLSNDTSVDVKGLAKDCAGISWDPYGRVFDSQTLEPIPDVIVELIDESTKQPVAMTFNLSYDVTGDDGLYNIQVEKEGIYSLTVDSLTTHTFVKNPKLHPNWKYIYSDLYYPGDIFTETQNVPTHHDIPLFLEGEPFRDAVAKIVPGTLKSEDMSGVIVYTGRTTFPMAQICLIHEKTGEKVGQCVNANNIGNFSIAMEKGDIPSSRLRVSAQKVDLTNPALFTNPSEVEVLHMNSLMLPEIQSPYYFDPILSLVEGYAQDVGGKRIGDSVVQVRLKSNKQLFFETKADPLGFFAIYEPNLPTLEYYLEFADPKTGKRVTQSTSEFIDANKEYLETNNINLVTATKDNEPVEIKKVDGRMGSMQSESDPEIPQNQQVIKTNTLDPRIAVVAVILFALVAIGIAAVILIKRQSKVV